MQTEAPVNSLNWWEHYFADDWQRHGGPAQTRHFMQRLLAELPPLDRAVLAESSLTVLDWGCAFGDGCAELAAVLPKARITGLDAAQAALASARARFPSLQFEPAPIEAPPGTLPRPFDVVVNSNALEHFARPLDVLRANLAGTRLLHISLVPYREDPLSVHHVTHFDADSFPPSIGGFERVFAKVIDVDPAYWPSGKQLLVGYASGDYMGLRAAIEPKVAEQQKWDHYYSELPLVEVDPLTRAFGDELVAAVRELLPAGGRVLEAGCGGGQQSLALARAGFEVTLLDFSASALDYARRLFEREGVAASYVRADAFEPGEPKYDLVFNAGVLEHYELDEQARFLRGMASRSRGYVLALIPNRACYWYWVWRVRKAASSDWPFGKEVPQSSLADAFAAAGVEHLGECYLGAAWTEYFIENSGGLDPDLKQLLLELHRSPVVPAMAKGYLTAALGRIKDITHGIPGRWLAARGSMDATRAEERWTALLADALAGKIAADERAREMPRLTRDLTNARDEAGSLQSRLLQSEGERDTLQAQRDAVQAQRDALQSERDAIKAQRDSAQSERDALQAMLASTRDELSGAQTTANDLRSQLHRAGSELNAIRVSRGYRALQAFYRVRLRLLPRGSRREQAARAVWRFARAVRSRARALLDEAGADKASGPHRRTERAAGTGTGIATFDLSGYAPLPRGYALVVLPIVEWEFRFQRPQQLARQFARAGHRVLFASHQFAAASVTREVEDGVTEIDLPGRRGVNPYKDSLDDHASDLMAHDIAEWLQRSSVGPCVCVVQLPFWAPVADALRRALGCAVVYDCMDDHAGFASNTPQMLAAEQHLRESAELTVVSSQALLEKAAPHARKAMLVRNAADYQHFAAIERRPRGMRPDLVIGYYGAIADWFDSDLVGALAAARPDWTFELVGSTWSADVGPLRARPNIKLLGEVPYAKLPEALRSWDCCIIPFRRTPLTEATNPVKVYEMLAAAMPVVAVGLPELRPLADAGLIKLADDAAGFAAAIEAAVAADGEEAQRTRQRFAQSNTWADRFAAFDAGVRALYPLVSIVVITYNNLELNRLCLDSVLRDTDYPNIEVIVVDNGSTDGTPQYLEQIRDPRVRVLRNADNRGYAAANNQGVQAAQGEFICLLNNDTVVTGAWLSALIRHLNADPTLGLVGPVTNAIANEARIEVGYSRLADMPRWADRWCAEHRGQTSAAPMLAFFCVALRRRLWDEIGPLDERFGKGMFEDDDYCRRVRAAGHSIRFAFDSFVHHWQRASFALLPDAEYLRVYDENRRRYRDKWHVEPAATAAARGAPASAAGAAAAPVHSAAPHAAVRFLRSIDVDVIDRDFAPGSIVTPFSLVTTIKNEAAGIVDFLASIEQQSAVPGEVIVVDGGSTDGTVDLVAQFQQRTRLALKLIHAPGANIAQGRNLGIRAAGSELLVLTDAGCQLDRDFCKNLVGCFGDARGADLASGICLPLRTSTAYFVPDWEPLDWSDFLPSARCLAIRKSLALEVGGFPEHLPLTGEDTLFDVDYRRRSRRWVFNRKAIIHWEAPASEEAARRVAFSYGKGDGESGVGDYRYADIVHELVYRYPYDDGATDDPVWREFFRGYLDGRRRRAEIEFARRGIRGVVLVLSVAHIADPDNRDTAAALELLARGFKVVFVNAEPYRGRARWFDVDYTLLELYAAAKFNWEEFLARYGAYADRVSALYPVYHPVLGALVERLKAKTGNRLRFASSIEEIGDDAAAPTRWGGSTVLPAPIPSRRRAVAMVRPTAPDPAQAGAARSAAAKFWRVTRQHGIGQAVRLSYGRIAGALSRSSPERPAPSPAAVGIGRDLRSYDVVSLPIMPWSSRFQRSQQLLTRFAAHGTRVFRVDRGFLVDDAREYVERIVHPNVLEVTLAAAAPLSIYTDAIDEASLARMLRSFEALRADRQIGNAVCIVELPFWYPLAKELRARYGWEIVYDCMDEHEGFSTNEGQMVSQETRLARDAALVVVTSQYLERKMAQLNPRHLLVRNATDFEHFARRPAEDRCRDVPHPIIGYYGAISEWFDQDLVAHSATKLSHCSFVLIGGNDAGGSLATLERLPNVRLLGEQPYAELPKYLHAFDVCIIPFKLGKLMEATNPVKFYEYLSAGKPVVSVMLPELFPYREHLYLADGRDDFVDKLTQALAENGEDVRPARIALARENTWEVRYQAFRDAVDALFPAVSIVIVTYGNLEVTRRCVDSVFTRSQYSRFEVIVVDNGSTDGTPEYLRELAARNPDVKIILNPDNKGFAAANNQGLGIADGEVIILLNNDTVVTPGWISKLTRYLKDDAIGMVGPATSMCGNESIVHVAYDVTTLHGMDEFVSRYDQLHPQPDAFDIDMLAMFCVALRRKTVDEIGPLDERFGVGMFEDTDYAERLKRAGYRIVSARDVFIHHDCKSSFGKLPSEEYLRIYEENRRKFEEKWGRRSQY